MAILMLNAATAFSNYVVIHVAKAIMGAVATVVTVMEIAAMVVIVIVIVTATVIVIVVEVDAIFELTYNMLA